MTFIVSKVLSLKNKNVPAMCRWASLRHLCRSSSMCRQCAGGHLFGTFIVSSVGIFLACAGDVPVGTCSAHSAPIGMCRGCAGRAHFRFLGLVIARTEAGLLSHPLAAWGDTRKYLVEVAVAGRHLRHSPTDWEHCPAPHSMNKGITLCDSLIDGFAHIVGV